MHFFWEKRENRDCGPQKGCSRHMTVNGRQYVNAIIVSTGIVSNQSLIWRYHIKPKVWYEDIISNQSLIWRYHIKPKFDMKISYQTKVWYGDMIIKPKFDMILDCEFPSRCWQLHCVQYKNRRNIFIVYWMWYF